MIIYREDSITCRKCPTIGLYQDKYAPLSFSILVPSTAADSSAMDRDEISFLDRSEHYCVCYVDMVDSTRVISQINKSEKIA